VKNKPGVLHIYEEERTEKKEQQLETDQKSELLFFFFVKNKQTNKHNKHYRMDEKSTAVASYNREALEGKHGYDKSVPIVESENDLSSGGEGQVMDTLLEYGPSQYVASDHQEKVPSKSSKKASLQDVLNAILPPRVFTTSEGHKVRQQASIRKAERDDVIALQMSLDERLQERQARESGLCPVREQLYSQCYGKWGLVSGLLMTKCLGGQR